MTERAPWRVRPRVWPALFLGVGLWLIAWVTAWPISHWLAFDLIGLRPGSQLGDAVVLFLFDVPKVLLVLLGTVMVVTFVRGYFPPERVRAVLSGRGALAATAAAAGFGILTPLCSCSAVPLFSSFMEAGIPTGVTFAFLISSPMVNGVALALLWGLLGPGVTLLYLAAGLVVAIVGGLVLGRPGLERWVEPWVLEIRAAGGATSPDLHPTTQQRMRDAWTYTRDLVRTVLPWVLVGIGAAAFIEGFVPPELVAQVGGRDNPLALPIAILIAIPLYSNAAGTIPIVGVLVAKGLPLGTTLAFLMAIAVLSLPGFVILRQVIQPRLIALFTGVVALGIFVVGLLFNAFGP